jgi:hypothetical protein
MGREGTNGDEKSFWMTGVPPGDREESSFFREGEFDVDGLDGSASDNIE